MQGRTQQPQLRPELCGTCRICLDGCPGRVFRDLSAETDTLRGRLARQGQPKGSVDRPPCSLACPLAQDIPGYLARIASGDVEGSLAWILQDNPFPAVLGHVCHHPCESACLSGSIPRTPAIRELKRFASMARRPEIKLHPGPSKGKVAILGAGPAGLAAAWALSREGVKVRVIESLPVPGGLLGWAIPPFRLPRKAVLEDVDYILQHGVDLRLNTRLAPEKVMGLLAKYDAVVLACGASTPRQTNIPGSRLPHVWLGLDFLRRFALGPPPEIVPPVVVVGGGNVATDAARCAVRLASPVMLIYRRDRQEMPAYPEEVEASEAEGIRFLFRSIPMAFEGGRRIGVEQVRIQATSPGAPGKDGRPSFFSIAETEKILPARTVILALGQEKGFAEWTESLGSGTSDLSKNGLLRDRIYAAGDMVTGPATVVEAVAGGINCAHRILREVFA